MKTDATVVDGISSKFRERSKTGYEPGGAHKLRSAPRQSRKYTIDSPEDDAKTGMSAKEEHRREFERLSSQFVYVTACEKAGLVPKTRIKDVLGYSTELEIEGVCVRARVRVRVRVRVFVCVCVCV
jgi:hypothetical protein